MCLKFGVYGDFYYFCRRLSIGIEPKTTFPAAIHDAFGCQSSMKRDTGYSIEISPRYWNGVTLKSDFWTMRLLLHRLDALEPGREFQETFRTELCPAKGLYGVQIPKGAWHTIEVFDKSTIFEAKNGAYGK